MSALRLFPILMVLAGCPSSPSKPVETGETGGGQTDLDGDGYAEEEDCDDNDATVHPNATETCDGLDNDCDGATDEEVSSTWYRDMDNDGFGDDADTLSSCDRPEGYVPSGADCDDADPVRFPSNPEVCDDKDNNCDGTVDEGLTLTWYPDSDVDGWGDGAFPRESCNQPTGYVEDGTDCDDSTSRVHPEAPEVCDEADNDCDGVSDEEVTATWYVDADRDGWGSTGGTTEACAQPTGYAATSTDCDDGDGTVHPDADEVCDGADNDCDGETDEDSLDRSTWYADGDGDGWGDPDLATEACSAPDGHVANDEDCDDANPMSYPGAAETCDDQDNDCDGSTDESTADAPTWYLDADGDGWGTSSVTARECDAPTGFVTEDGDCDDLDASAFPAALEICDGADNDCDGNADEDAVDASPWYLDADRDGAAGYTVTRLSCLAPDGYLAVATDCDDTDATILPGALETCDGQDQDCDGDIDEEALDVSTWYRDGDRDGWGDGAWPTDACAAPSGYVDLGTDCDDGNPSIYPDAPEICDDLDNDCDAAVDEDSTDANTWYRDADGDTFGNAAVYQYACDAPPGYVANATDCADADATLHPGADEVCDGQDQDCDGSVDEGLTLYTGWADLDGDGYGTSSTSVTGCALPSAYVTNDDDCDDLDVGRHPGVAEVCDDQDQDCDGSVDEGLTSYTAWWDGDGDGYGTPSVSLTDCAVPSGYVSNDDDCDDTTSDRRPGAFELCDGVDNDCDGVTDDGVVSYTWYQDGDGDGYGDTLVRTTSCAWPAGFSSNDDDCDDTDGATFPGAPEACDGEDDDCDGTVDDGAKSTWYRDGDADGYGDAATTSLSCAAPSGYLSDATDCDDTQATTHPGASETCDGEDDDCDGTVDDGVTTPYYADGDGDGYGDAGSIRAACSLPTGYTTDATDCDDASSLSYPGAPETCDGADNDCDGSTDEGSPTGSLTWYADADGDTYGDAATPTLACEQPADFVADSTDCDDTDATVYPGSTAPDTPGDGVDQDCDGIDACADLNCDAWPDIVFPGYRSGTSGSYTTTSYAYFGTGYGYATSYRTSFSTSGARNVVIEDLDEDGYLDLLFLNYYNGTTYSLDSHIYWGSAAGYSSTDRQVLPTVGAVHAAVADLDEDGYKDIVVANYYTGSSYTTSSYIYWGSSAGYSSSDRSSLTTYGPPWVEIEDLDNDGWLDLVFAAYQDSDYSTSSYIYWGSSSGYSSTDRTSLSTYGARKTVIEDVNDDGWSDLLFVNYYTGSSYYTSSYLYYGSATGYSSAARLSLPTYGAMDAEIQDLNHDGYPDIVFAQYRSDDDYTINSYIYWGTAAGYSTASRTSIANNGPREVEIADLDLDGWDDLVFAAYYDGTDYTTSSYIYWGSAAGYSSTDRSSLTTYGAIGVDSADLDLDGWPDLVFNNYYTGSTYSTDSYVFYNTAGVFSSSVRDDLPTQGAMGAVGVAGAL